MKALFLCSPPEEFIPYKDTTKMLMLEAASRGVEVFAATHVDLSAQGCEVSVFARHLMIDATVDAQSKAWVAPQSVQLYKLEEFDSIWFRHDPPFDDLYLHATHLVDLAVRQYPNIQTINSPFGLRYANEKLFAMEFSEWMPKTLVSSNPQQILSFIDEVGGVGVVKPIDGFGGQGIFKLSSDDANAGVILQTVTAQGWTMAQAYIDGVDQGDMRVLLMDGEVIGQFLRVPKAGEFRGNMAQGGSVEAIELSEQSLKIIDAVRPRLQELGLRLVGLDIVADVLTEINVTSPTGFQEAARLGGFEPQQRVWDRILEAGHQA